MTDCMIFQHWCDESKVLFLSLLWCLSLHACRGVINMSRCAGATLHLTFWPLSHWPLDPAVLMSCMVRSASSVDGSFCSFRVFFHFICKCIVLLCFRVKCASPCLTSEMCMFKIPQCLLVHINSSERSDTVVNIWQWYKL